jgi:hypothetical protein
MKKRSMASGNGQSSWILTRHNYSDGLKNKVLWFSSKEKHGQVKIDEKD